MKNHLLRHEMNAAAALNRISMVRQMMPEPAKDGPEPEYISLFGTGSIYYAAGHEQANLPNLLDAFGRDGWILLPNCGQPSLQKRVELGVVIEIHYVDPESKHLPNCCRIPAMDQRAHLVN